jgi:hypothetical protein
MITTVYAVVETGYEDHIIAALFSTRSKADEYRDWMAEFSGLAVSVETYHVLDTADMPKVNRWVVWMTRDEVYSVMPIDPRYYGPDFVDEERGDLMCSNDRCMHVLADSRDEAMAKAEARREKMITEGTWETIDAN